MEYLWEGCPKLPGCGLLESMLYCAAPHWHETRVLLYEGFIL